MEPQTTPLCRQSLPAPLTPVQGTGGSLSAEEHASREKQKCFDATVEERDRERSVLIKEQIRAETRQITRERELLALREELAEIQAETAKNQVHREMVLARRLAYHCANCFALFNVDEQGNLHLKVTKGRHVCGKNTDGTVIGDLLCIKERDVNRKSKPTGGERLSGAQPLEPSRNGHRRRVPG